MPLKVRRQHNKVPWHAKSILKDVFIVSRFLWEETEQAHVGDLPACSLGTHREDTFSHFDSQGTHISADIKSCFICVKNLCFQLISITLYKQKMLQTLILQRKSCAALIKWPQLVKQSPSFWFDFLETQHWLFYASTDTHCIY